MKRSATPVAMLTKIGFKISETDRTRTRFRQQIEAPNIKLQAPEKLQIPSSNPAQRAVGVWILMFL
jgi:hypothetical protein